MLDFPGSIFYNPRFLEIAAEILSLKPTPLVFLSNDNPIGLANIMLKRRLSVTSATIPRLFQYYGFETLNKQTGIFQVIDNWLTHNVDLAVLSLSPNECGQDQYPGWEISERLTYVIKPDTYENMRKIANRNTNRAITRALEANLNFTNVGELPYEIYRASLQRHGIMPPLAEANLCRWVKILTDCGMGRTYAIAHKGETIAFRTQLIYGKYAYDWLAGSTPKANEIGANQYLVLRIGEILHSEGVSSWDLLGGDIPSIGEFKRAFGSRPLRHLQLEKCFTGKGRLYRRLMKFKERFRG